MKNTVGRMVFAAGVMMFSINTALSAPALAKSHGDKGNGNNSRKGSTSGHLSSSDAQGHQTDVHLRNIEVQGVIEKVSGAINKLTAYQQVSQVGVRKADKPNHKATNSKAHNNQNLQSAVHFLQSAVKQISVIESVYAPVGANASTATSTTVTETVYSPGTVVSTLQAISAQLQTDESAIAQIGTDASTGVTGIIGDLVQQRAALQALGTTTVILPRSKDNKRG